MLKHAKKPKLLLVHRVKDFFCQCNLAGVWNAISSVILPDHLDLGLLAYYCLEELSKGGCLARERE